MSIIFGIIIGLIVLTALVVAHEFGHFIMARRNGVKVLEFGIGFPPRGIAWVKQKHPKNGKKWKRLPRSEWGKPQEGLIFSLNWLPIGGFCSMDGENATDKRLGTFGAANFWAKTKILFGGVFMNWLVAFIILTVLALTGMPQFINNQFYAGNDSVFSGNSVTVVNVIEGSPAAQAGIEKGDQIIGVGNAQASPNELFLPDVVSKYGQDHQGKTGHYEVRKSNGEIKNYEIELNSKNEEYILGVSMSYAQSYVRSTWSAPIVGLATTVQLTGETFRGLGELVWNLCSGAIRQLSFDGQTREEGREDIGTVGDSVSGPVGIIGTIFPSFAAAGISNLAFLTALISVSLACMNVLPIPALDGGRWLIIAIYKLRKKELTKETEEKIVSRAFLVLFALIIIITVLDIIKLF